MGNPNKNPGKPNKKLKPLIIVLNFGFPRLFRKSGKSKKTIGGIQIKNWRNLNKKSVFYRLDFTDFIFGFPGFLFGFHLDPSFYVNSGLNFTNLDTFRY
jgi:hypothetical protein